MSGIMLNGKHVVWGNSECNNFLKNGVSFKARSHER